MKLDNFSKILLATGQINYCANTLNALIANYKTMTQTVVVSESLAEKEVILEQTLEGLKDVLSNISDYLNGIDAVYAIDERISWVASEILFFEMDEIEEDYPRAATFNQ